MAYRLLEEYRAMALDRAREAEAQEWCEGLIGDAPDQEDLHLGIRR